MIDPFDLDVTERAVWWAHPLVIVPVREVDDGPIVGDEHGGRWRHTEEAKYEPLQVRIDLVHREAGVVFAVDGTFAHDDRPVSWWRCHEGHSAHRAHPWFAAVVDDVEEWTKARGPVDRDTWDKGVSGHPVQVTAPTRSMGRRSALLLPTEDPKTAHEPRRWWIHHRERWSTQQYAPGGVESVVCEVKRRARAFVGQPNTPRMRDALALEIDEVINTAVAAGAIAFGQLTAIDFEGAT